MSEKKTKRLTAKEKQERVDIICSYVAEGKTLREIAVYLGVTAGGVIRMATENKEFAQQYARARDAASDIFESNIIDRAASVTSETAAADRVAIDALKWVAARRSPKKYSEKFSIDHTSDGEKIKPTTINLIAPEK